MAASGTLRLVLGGSMPQGDQILVQIEGSPVMVASVRNRRLGPTGEAILECVMESVRRAS